MKGGKEEGKIMGPLFPRLHVNDTEKGGPRAPPRNKMALYEQLSIPSQRFNHSAASALPLPPYNARTSVASASSSQGGSHERSMLSPFHIPQSPGQSADMVHSRSLDAKNRSVAGCSSFRPHDFSSKKKSCEEQFDDDDFRVPTFMHPEIAQSNKETLLLEAKRLTPLGANSPQKNRSSTLKPSIEFPSSYGKPVENPNADTLSRKHERDRIKPKTTETLAVREKKEKSVSYLEIGKTVAGPSQASKSSADQENMNARTVIDRQYCLSGAMDGPGCLNNIGVAENKDVLKLATESCIKPSGGDDHKSSTMNQNRNRGNDGKAGGLALEDLNADKDLELSDTSMEEDTVSGLEISPDDVVGIIGPKQFWKARRAIVNQQRVFAVQVFELHRLIKVQKLIAASPQLLLEDNNLFLNGSSQEVPNKNPLEPGHRPQPRPVIDKQKDDSEKTIQEPECEPEVARAPLLPSRSDELNKGPHHNPQPPPVPVVGPAESRPNAWCYQTPNHWLVPVMSPSEGLIYKPYSGLYPPGTGFMTPIYGNSMSLPSVPGDFMNPAFAVAAPHQQQNMAVHPGASTIPQKYFPSPYGLPVMNTNVPSSVVEQVSPIVGPRPTVQIEQQSRNSCNMTIQRSEGVSFCPVRLHPSKDSELQGSTASSPCEALPLFPTAPAVERSLGGEQQTRAIKVVPHNARLATASAARIFRSIQEERQQFEQ